MRSTGVRSRSRFTFAPLVFRWADTLLLRIRPANLNLEGPDCLGERQLARPRILAPAGEERVNCLYGERRAERVEH